FNAWISRPFRRSRLRPANERHLGVGRIQLDPAQPDHVAASALLAFDGLRRAARPDGHVRRRLLRGIHRARADQRHVAVGWHQLDPRLDCGRTGPLLLSSISTTGDFAVTAGDCPTSPSPLAVGARCFVQVTYSPTVCGTRLGSLIFADNSTGGTESVTLEGGVLSPGCDGDLELIAQQDVTVNASSAAGATITYNKLLTVDEESTAPP